MKLAIIVVIALILLTSFAYADTERITLLPGQSFLFDGKNISLIDTSPDSIIICVNGEKTIISDEKTISDVLIGVSDSSESDARLRIEYDCSKDCKCDGNECNNNACFRFAAETSTSVGQTSTTLPGVTSSIADNDSETSETTTSIIAGQGENEVDLGLIKKLTYALIGVAIVIGIAAYSRKRKMEEEEYMREAEEHL